MLKHLAFSNVYCVYCFKHLAQIFFLYQRWCCQMLWATLYFLSLYDLWLGKQKTIQSTQNRFVYKNTHSKAFEKKNIWILWKYLLSVPLEFRWNLYITNKFNIKLLFFIDFSSIFIDLVLKLLVRSLKFRLWAQNKVVFYFESYLMKFK